MAKMTVITERCKGCGLCTTACPKKIVEIQKEKRNRKGYFTSGLFLCCMYGRVCLHRMRNVRYYVPGLRYCC